MNTQVRIDKWLWSVRIFKTRVIAREACIGGKIKIGEKKVKPSYKIKPQELIQVRKGIVKYLYKVLQTTEKRLGAKHIKNFVEDLTPNSEIEKLNKTNNQKLFLRKKGQGRPTKKERRIIDKLRNQY